MVVCTGFRNPALTAKMSSTLDVISNGRFELGIGAGWKEDEWIAYGYGFPPLRERLAVLADHLEIIRRMLEPGRASYEGRYARVDGAINVPKGIQQPRLPIIVGGNGQNVTFRLAARFAEELNLVFLDPAEVGEHMAVARQRCEEEGRDPATLRLSLYCRDGDVRAGGPGAGRSPGRLRGAGAGPPRRLPVALGHVRRRAGALRRGLPGRRAAARRREWPAPRADRAPHCSQPGHGAPARRQRSRPILPGGP